MTSPLRRQPRVSDVAAVVDAIEKVRAARRQYVTRRDARRRWAVTVSSDDDLFSVAHDWFLGLLDEPPRVLSARLGRRSGDGGLVGDSTSDSTSARTGRRTRREVVLRYEDYRPRDVVFRGHGVRVELLREGRRVPQDADPFDDQTPATSSGDDDRRGLARPDVLVFSVTSEPARAAVVAHLRELAAARQAVLPRLRVANQWGGWTNLDTQPPRPLSSVVLRAGVLDDVTSDLGAFLDAEDWHVSRGLPWHRGYLLSGPPGTGKTSLVRGLSSHYGLDLWYLPLGDLSSDVNLLQLVSEVRSGILLLEDVDVYAGQVADREDAESSTAGGGRSRAATLAGLLNALDGATTPHGLVTVMTSNRPDVLDPALTRPGRVDARYDLGDLDPEQADRLYEWYHESAPPRPHTWGDVRGVSPAELVGTFRLSREPS